jgi:hypothetical protein
VFCFEGRAGGRVVAEVQARRLNSPVDSWLRMTDASGEQLMVNDDYEDKGAGLATHHADSRICVTLPEDGTYFVHLGDTQNKGGTAYGYRLRVSARRPDFELRVVPSSINARAGSTVPITVYALRRDEFSDDISLVLKDAPPGFVLSGGWVPADQDKIRLTLTVPSGPSEGPTPLSLEGRAVIRGKEIRRSVVPADDMMQAFIYHHLVPAENFLAWISGTKPKTGPTKERGKAPSPAPPTFFEDGPVKLPAGGTKRVQIATAGLRIPDRLTLQLDEPPEGITMQRVWSARGTVEIHLQTDAAKVEPGLKGNLIVGGFRPGARNRGRPVATLPAIPFEIVEASDRTEKAKSWKTNN